MTINESPADRTIRGVVAVAAIGTAFAVAGPTTPAGIVLLVVGALAGVTAAVGFCPAYRLFGISTAK